MAMTERELIARIRGGLAAQDGAVVKGIGDDCAVIRVGLDKLWLVTTDALVEGVHFELSWHPPELLGRKSAAVNLSDIAAMGGIPRFALLTIAIADPQATWLPGFLAGFSASLAEHNTMLIGGDTVKSPAGTVMFSVTLIGEAREDEVLYRSGARPRDLIWVGGPLGEAAAGLELCRRGLSRQPKLPADWRPLVKAHLDPQPQMAFGRALANSHLAHAMIDLSDGLATDLAQICAESGVGAEIAASALPLSAPLLAAARALRLSARDLALYGGEDYLLLFTTAPDHEARVRQLAAGLPGLQIHCIGRIKAGGGVSLNEEDGGSFEIGFKGYDHFRVAQDAKTMRSHEGTKHTWKS